LAVYSDLIETNEPTDDSGKITELEIAVTSNLLLLRRKMCVCCACLLSQWQGAGVLHCVSHCGHRSPTRMVRSLCFYTSDC